MRTPPTVFAADTHFPEKVSLVLSSHAAPLLSSHAAPLLSRGNIGEGISSVRVQANHSGRITTDGGYYGSELRICRPPAPAPPRRSRW